MINILIDRNVIVEIYNIYGTIVASTKLKSIDISNFEKGIYLMKIFNSKRELIKSEKIIKQ